MNDYWAAWREIVELSGEIARDMRQLIKAMIGPAALMLALIGWVVGEALLLSAGEYWQAAAVFIVSIVLGMLIGGHVVALTIMKYRKEEASHE